jgi:hypothetical protein
MRFKSAAQRKAVMAKYRQVQIATKTVKVARQDGKIVGVHAREKGYPGSRFFMPKYMYAEGREPKTYIVLQGTKYYG